MLRPKRAINVEIGGGAVGFVFALYVERNLLEDPTYSVAWSLSEICFPIPSLPPKDELSAHSGVLPGEKVSTFPSASAREILPPCWNAPSATTNQSVDSAETLVAVTNVAMKTATIFAL